MRFLVKTNEIQWTEECLYQSKTVLIDYARNWYNIFTNIKDKIKIKLLCYINNKYYWNFMK